MQALGRWGSGAAWLVARGLLSTGCEAFEPEDCPAYADEAATHSLRVRIVNEGQTPLAIGSIRNGCTARNDFDLHREQERLKLDTEACSRTCQETERFAPCRACPQPQFQELPARAEIERSWDGMELVRRQQLQVCAGPSDSRGVSECIQRVRAKPGRYRVSVQARSISPGSCPPGVDPCPPQADADAPSISISAEFNFPDDDEVVVVFR